MKNERESYMNKRITNSTKLDCGGTKKKTILRFFDEMSRARRACSAHSTKTNNRVGKQRFLYSVYAFVVVVGVMAGMAVPVFADGDPLSVVNNLSTFIFGLIRAVGIILLGWGVVQVGMSFQSHDPSQRSQGFLTLAGGLVITFAKEILTLIGVS